MTDADKTREQLIAELQELREEITVLRAATTTEAGGLSESAMRSSLMRSVEMFRALFEQASDNIFLMEVKEEGGSPTIIDANISACRSHGYEKHELVGQPISLLDTPETARHVSMRTERMMAGKRLFFEGAHRRKDGSEFPVEVAAQMVDVGGRLFIIGVDRDISQHKAAEERLKANARQLRESNQKLQGLAYLASHELHAPLISVVRALSALMQKAGPGLGPEETGYLRSAKMSAEGLLASVRQLIHGASPTVLAERRQEQELV
jgi:PAS domain S-box-containing protein